MAHRPWLKGFIVTAAIWGLFFVLLWPRLVFNAPNGLHIGAPYMWGDWALHYTVSAVAAFRPLSCWFDHHPVYANRNFDYPFVVDFISGLMTRAGFDFADSFLIPSIALSLLFVFSIYFFVWKITRSGRVGFGVVTLLILSCGIGFLDFIKAWTVVPELLGTDNHLYSHDGKLGYHYGNMLITEFLPQRAFLLGTPITLYLMTVLICIHQKNRSLLSKSEIVTLFLQGVLAGCLLFIHPHSYLVFVMFAVLVAVTRLAQWQRWMAFALGAFVPSLCWLMYFRGESSGGFFKWYPGWMAYEAESGNLGFFKFWFLNWGFLLPLAVWSTWKNKLYKNPVVMFGFLLFGICNLVRFQPWAWDNVKLFTYSYLFLAIPVALLMSQLMRHRRWFVRAGGAVLSLSLVATGLIDVTTIVRQSKPGSLMYTVKEQEMAAQLRAVTDPCGIVLTSSYHHHWVPALAGRQILLGYPGWVASYGIDYGFRAREIEEMYTGGRGALGLLRKYDIKHVVVGPSEERDYKVNKPFFAQNFDVVFVNDSTTIYRAKF